MPLFRVTIVDKTGKVHTEEVRAGNLCGAKQQALVKCGSIHPNISHRNQNKNVVIRSIVEVPDH